MDFGLKGKTVLVLAGGGGLGRATAVALAKEGANLAVAGIGAKSVDETIAALAPMGTRTMPLVWDLADLSVIDANVSKIEAELGPVDILFNNTGGPPPTAAAGQDPAVWMKQFQAMILSVIATTDRVLPNMKARKWGRIITNTSSGIISPIPNLGISNTLRASLVGWSKTLAREVAKDGITCNIVVPGRIATARVAALNKARAEREGRTEEEVAAETIATIPAGRFGKPEEFGDLVAFLASERTAYMTGSIFRIEGGMIASI